MANFNSYLSSTSELLNYCMHLKRPIRNALRPSPASQDFLETRIFTQFRKIWPILACEQTRVANSVSLSRKSHRFVLFPRSTSGHTKVERRDIASESARFPSWATFEQGMP
jgi:hypothetical protein